MSYKRLNAIVDLIKKDEKILDVGTDHGLVPIFLLKRGVTSNIDASDINEGPLNSARENLIKEGFEGKVNLILSNGLENIETLDHDSIVIAGMGGNTIRDIISQKEYNGQYIIYATNALENVREKLAELNFEITNEVVVFERRKFNVIMVANKVDHEVEYDFNQLKFGPVLQNNKDKTTVDYYNNLYNLYERNSSLSKDESYKIKEREWLKNWINHVN